MSPYWQQNKTIKKNKWKIKGLHTSMCVLVFNYHTIWYIAKSDYMYKVVFVKVFFFRAVFVKVITKIEICDYD